MVEKEWCECGKEILTFLNISKNLKELMSERFVQRYLSVEEIEETGVESDIDLNFNDIFRTLDNIKKECHSANIRIVEQLLDEAQEIYKERYVKEKGEYTYKEAGKKIEKAEETFKDKIMECGLKGDKNRSEKTPIR